MNNTISPEENEIIKQCEKEIKKFDLDKPLFSDAYSLKYKDSKVKDYKHFIMPKLKHLRGVKTLGATREHYKELIEMCTVSGIAPSVTHNDVEYGYDFSNFEIDTNSAIFNIVFKYSEKFNCYFNTVPPKHGIMSYRNNKDLEDFITYIMGLDFSDECEEYTKLEHQYAVCKSSYCSKYRINKAQQQKKSCNKLHSKSKTRGRKHIFKKPPKVVNITPEIKRVIKVIKVKNFEESQEPLKHKEVEVRGAVVETIQQSKNNKWVDFNPKYDGMCKLLFDICLDVGLSDVNKKKNQISKFETIAINVYEEFGIIKPFKMKTEFFQFAHRMLKSTSNYQYAQENFYSNI